MNKAQRSRYFSLWNTAAEEQRWNPKDADRRRSVTLEATGQASTSGLSQEQITALFQHLQWLANQYDLDLAMPVANPEQTTEINKQRQLVWKITQEAAQAGLSAEYLDKAAADKVRAHQCRRWQELPMVELLKFAFTIRKRAQAKKRQ